MKPVLLLDIDGVLAPFSSGPDSPWKDTHKFHYLPGGGAVFLHHELPEIIERLSRHYTLMWGTAWEETANDLLEMMGLEDPLDHICFIRSTMGTGSWKLPSIEEFAAKDERPIVWIDDEALGDAVEWAERRTKEGIPTLTIRTNPLFGFLDEHLEDLEKWAEEISADTTA